MPRSKERNSKKTKILNWYARDIFITVAYELAKICVCIIRKVILNLTQVQQMIRNKMTKLFADYELKRQKMEEVDANDRYVQGERS